METQILNLQAPFEYIHCNGEVGKHIATLIVYEAMKGEDGSYKLESHSHPIVKYWNAPGGVVWNQAELTDCDVVCDENSLGVDSHSFFRMVRKKWGIENDTDYREKAKQLRETLIDYDIMISDEELLAKYKNMIIHEWNHNIMLIFEKKEGKIVCFRPDMNAERMYDSAGRMEMPPFPKDRFLKAVDEVIKAKRMVSTGGHYAYLKIAEGCDKNCTYCIIPKIRGHYRSVPKEKLIAEAKSLARDGVTELILVAQETTLYGLDLYGQKSLHLLLRELCQIE